MQELITEIAFYLGIAAFLGFLLGWLIWGLGFRRRMAVARADGAADAHPRVVGDGALRNQVNALARERDRLEQRVAELSERLAQALENRPAPPSPPAMPVAPTATSTDPADADGIGEPDGPGEAPERLADHGLGDDNAVRPQGHDPDNIAGPDDDADRPAHRTPDPENDETATLASEALPSFLLAGAPETPDDLTLIRGIGGSTAKILNQHGIWLFRQLADLSPDDVAWLQKTLGEQTSRSLETWPEQARILMEA